LVEQLIRNQQVTRSSRVAGSIVLQAVKAIRMSDDLLGRLAKFTLAAATVATAALCVVPLLALATGAYASLPIGVGAVSRLLLLFLPQAIAVALPIAVATAVFFVCRSVPITRQVCVTVGAFTVAATLITTALNVSVAPVANATYRKLAFSAAEGRFVNGRRLNAPGEPGDHFQIEHRRALSESVVVLAALAIAASRVAPSHAKR
jgi:hypothetical protein